jgi:hypothetical protein
MTMKTLTFAETLHPETAQVHVDPQNGSTTVWATVMHEIRTDLPVAVAVEYKGQDQDPLPGEVTRIPEGSDENTEMPPGGGCFYLEGLLGCSLTLTAVLATFAVELVAAICYCMAAGFYRYIGVLETTPMLIKAIVMVVVHALMVSDAILLTVSLVLTEILGWVAGIVTTIFNPSSRCFAGGKAWHAYVRKVCHLTRWAFRGFHEGWALPRLFPRLEFGEQEAQVHCENEPSTEPEQAVVTHQVEAPHTNVSTKLDASKA